ncbi:ABC transporter I family member 6, chloroplastic [Cocos nucifera]|uniref:ABC transporter I family member 6, chloroplastic n=1 Tax=Cocos nucifera TaxID=13894 RepID=A0A8K0I6Q1_COCNU|nr:ABC transporter I family member 6, chloroplastic [Cocos nucifera]
MALAFSSSLSFSSSTPLPPFPSLPFRTSPADSSLITIRAPHRIRPISLCTRRSLRPKATVVVDSPTAGGAAPRRGPPRVLLEVKDLRAVIAESGQEILRGVNLTIYEGEVHAIMGKNGSGKSTLAKVLVGHPDYEVTGGSVIFKGENLLEMEPVERSHAGLFMSFQTPVEIPGFYSYVSPKAAAINMDLRFLDRNVNEGFSGGEKKRNEILQLAGIWVLELGQGYGLWIYAMHFLYTDFTKLHIAVNSSKRNSIAKMVLEADLAILDEIDSGLDVDALQDVAKAVNGLLTPNNSVLMITHYQRLLDFIKPSYVHIMEDGTIVRTGDVSLAKQLEKEGYRAFSNS